MERQIIQVEEKVPVKLLIPLSIQHMFAMFGASVLVPFYVRNQSGRGTSDERCGNAAVHSYHKGKSACLSGIQLRIFIPGPSGCRQVRL